MIGSFYGPIGEYMSVLFSDTLSYNFGPIVEGNGDATPVSLGRARQEKDGKKKKREKKKKERAE